MLMEKSELWKSICSAKVYLGQSQPQSWASAQSALCSVKSPGGMLGFYFRSFAETPAWIKSPSCQLKCGQKREFCSSLSTAKCRLRREGRRGHSVGSELQREPKVFPLGELHLALPTCHLRPFLQVPKNHWGGCCSKQGKATAEATGLYPLSPVTG